MAFAVSSTSSNFKQNADADWKAKRLEQDRRALSDIINRDHQKRLSDSLALWAKLTEGK